jgi:hypothetical protein
VKPSMIVSTTYEREFGQEWKEIRQVVHRFEFDSQGEFQAVLELLRAHAISWEQLGVYVIG